MFTRGTTPSKDKRVEKFNLMNFVVTFDSLVSMFSILPIPKIPTNAPTIKFYFGLLFLFDPSRCLGILRKNVNVFRIIGSDYNISKHSPFSLGVPIKL